MLAKAPGEAFTAVGRSVRCLPSRLSQEAPHDSASGAMDERLTDGRAGCGRWAALALVRDRLRPSGARSTLVSAARLLRARSQARRRAAMLDPKLLGIFRFLCIRSCAVGVIGPGVVRLCLPSLLAECRRV